MEALPIPSPEQSNAFARARDAKIQWLLTSHPVTATMLVQIKWFPSKTKALRRLQRLVARRRIQLVGTIQRHGVGRPEHVFARFRPKPDCLLHEVELTEVCLRTDAGIVRRGPQVTDPRIRPDAELLINGRQYALELDRGTEGYAQVLQRFAIYADYPHFVLWICPTVERREGFRTRATGIRHCALFATLPDVLVSPHQAIWWSVAGERVALPRQTNLPVQGLP